MFCGLLKRLLARTLPDMQQRPIRNISRSSNGNNENEGSGATKRQRALSPSTTSPPSSSLSSSSHHGTYGNMMVISADILFIAFSYLPIGSLANVSCSCRRLHSISYQRHMWARISTHDMTPYQHGRVNAHDIARMVTRADHYLHTLVMDGCALAGEHAIDGMAWDTYIMNNLITSVAMRKKPSDTIKLLSVRQCRIEDWSTLLVLLRSVPIHRLVTDVPTYTAVSLSMATSAISLIYSRLEAISIARGITLDGGIAGICPSLTHRHNHHHTKFQQHSPAMPHDKDDADDSDDTASVSSSSSSPSASVTNNRASIIRTCSLCGHTACYRCRTIVACSHCDTLVCATCNGTASYHCDNPVCGGGWQYDVCRSCTLREHAMFTLCVACQQQQLLHADGTPVISDTTATIASMWCGACARRCIRCDDTYCAAHAKTMMTMNAPASVQGVCHACSRVHILPQSVGTYELMFQRTLSDHSHAPQHDDDCTDPSHDQHHDGVSPSASASSSGAPSHSSLSSSSPMMMVPPSYTRAQLIGSTMSALDDHQQHVMTNQ